GQWLKFAALCIEFETTLMFYYITYALYNGMAPNDAPIIIWVAAVAITIVLFARWDLAQARKIKETNVRKK
ncbi:MAG: hypothetical protein HUJ76_12320, partial [Parasporobacterium sp.]|nr:hypothetical protein [Parasporobacterium sp.]